MYKKGYYHGKKQKEIEESIKQEGFDPVIISNNPGFIYSSHHHPEKKLLAFLKGYMDVTIGDQTYHCEKGDKVIIDGNTTHSAVVGDNGCTFFWSEKLE